MVRNQNEIAVVITDLMLSRYGLGGKNKPVGYGVSGQYKTFLCSCTKRQNNVLKKKEKLDGLQASSKANPRLAKDVSAKNLVTVVNRVNHKCVTATDAKK